MLNPSKITAFCVLGLAAGIVLATAGTAGSGDASVLCALALTVMAPATPVGAADREGFRERQNGAWRILPLEGAFEVVYEDANGAWTIRRVEAQELKVGPGKVLLGGVDAARDAYRGFRADRIKRLVDLESGAAIERNILDWLMKRSARIAKERLAKARRAAKAA